jgi:hypothetical protein
MKKSRWNRRAISTEDYPLAKKPLLSAFPMLGSAGKAMEKDVFLPNSGKGAGSFLPAP